MKSKIVSKDASETQSFASDFAKKLKGGEVIALYGQLGAGKTTFVQAMARSLGVNNKIISPTFVIMRSYQGTQFNFYHIDLYRINKDEEIENLGILELLKNPKNIIAIEWAEKMEKLLPKETKKIYLRYLNEDNREIEIL